MNKSKIKIYVLVLIQCTQWNIEMVYSVRANLCLIHDILRFKVPCSQTAQTGETTLYVQYGIHKQTRNMHYMKILSGNESKTKKNPQNWRFKDTVCKRLQEQKMQKVFCFFCGHLYEYTSRWYFNLADVLFISPKLKTGNPRGVSLSPKSASVKHPSPAVGLRLVKKEEAIMEIKPIVFDFL